jgi:predicted ABC-type ATPase
MIVVIGGPNGAGKSTVARDVLAETLGVMEFVNADAIALGLSGFNPDQAAFAAGRVMLERLRELGQGSTSFAFESTLSSRTFAPWLAKRAGEGWEVHLLYVWLTSPRLAANRVAARVKAGGHSIPTPVVTRRYWRSAFNLFRLYLPIATTWTIYDNSGEAARRIASFRPPHDSRPTILDRATFGKLERATRHAESQQDS